MPTANSAKENTAEIRSNVKPYKLSGFVFICLRKYLRRTGKTWSQKALSKKLKQNFPRKIFIYQITTEIAKGANASGEEIGKVCPMLLRLQATLKSKQKVFMELIN